MPERWQSEESESRKLSDGSSDHPRPKRRAIVEPLVLEAAEYHLNYAAHHTSLSSPRIIAAAAAAANRRRSSEGSLANLQSRRKTVAAVPANLSLTALSSLQQQLNGGTASVPRRSNNQLSKSQQLPAVYARTHYTTVDNTPLRHWSRAGYDENAGPRESTQRTVRRPPARSTPLSTQNSGRRTSAFDIEHSALPLPSPSRTAAAAAAAHGQHSPRTSPRARAIANPVLQWSTSSDTTQQQPQQQQRSPRSPRLQQTSPRLSQQQQQQQRQRDSYYFSSSSQDAHQSDSPAPERPPALRVRTTTTSSSGYERRGSGGSAGSAGSRGQRLSGRNQHSKHYSFTESEEDLAKQVN
jgi:hypothetical protein